MTVKDYLQMVGQDEKSCQNLTLIIVHAEKDDYSPFYHQTYTTTPINCVWEWWESEKVMNYIMLNNQAHAVDWIGGANWNQRIDSEIVWCFLVIAEEDFTKLYPSEEQRREDIEYRDRKLKESLTLRAQIDETKRKLYLASTKLEKLAEEHENEKGSYTIYRAGKIAHKAFELLYE